MRSQMGLGSITLFARSSWTSHSGLKYAISVAFCVNIENPSLELIKYWCRVTGVSTILNLASSC